MTLLYSRRSVKRYSDTQFPETPTTCAACGRKFIGRERFTFAAWFKFGTPRVDDLVHLRCARKRFPAERRARP